MSDTERPRRLSSQDMRYHLLERTGIIAERSRREVGETIDRIVAEAVAAERQRGIDLRNECQDRCARYLDQAERFKAERDAALVSRLELAEACSKITSIVADPNDGRDQYGSALARARSIARAALAAFEAQAPAAPAGCEHVWVASQPDPDTGHVDVYCDACGAEFEGSGEVEAIPAGATAPPPAPTLAERAGPLAEACRRIVAIEGRPDDGRDQLAWALADAGMIARAALAASETRGGAGAGAVTGEIIGIDRGDPGFSRPSLFIGIDPTEIKGLAWREGTRVAVVPLADAATAKGDRP
jgi:hypothetical protein